MILFFKSFSKYLPTTVPFQLFIHVEIVSAVIGREAAVRAFLYVNCRVLHVHVPSV